MAVNKVIVGTEVKLDLTADTVSEDNLLAGATAHNAAGEPIEGAVVTVPVDSELSEESTNAIQNMAVAKAVNVLKSDLVDIASNFKFKTPNMINASDIIDGQSITSSGGFYPKTNAHTTGAILVKNNTDYTIIFENCSSVDYVITASASGGIREDNGAFLSFFGLATKYDWVSIDENTVSIRFPESGKYSDIYSIKFAYEGDGKVYFIEGSEYVGENSLICPVPYIDDEIREIKSLIPTNKSIYCYGDSLTTGAGGNGTTYPNVLQSLLGADYTVYNRGVGGEKAHQISARYGVLPAIVNNITIPKDKSYVSVNLTNAFGNSLDIMGYAQNGNGGIYPATLNGVGIAMNKINGVNSIRLQDVSENDLIITRPSAIVTNSQNDKGILILCSGTNGWQSTNAEDLVALQKAMIDKNGNDAYIVIGLHANGSTELEELQLKAFGHHFINIRKYAVLYGLEDAGLSATEEDTTAIQNGKVPPSLLSDKVHWNSYGYTMIGNLVYKRGKELGLW